MTVTRDDVIAAYRLLLGREPSEKEASAWLHVPSISKLRELFIACDEFRALMSAASPSNNCQTAQRTPLDIPPIDVDWEAPPNHQALLLDRVVTTWTALGRREPHWSVLSAEVFKSKNIASHRDSFYESGRSDAHIITTILMRHGLTTVDFPYAVEYGCGVGRVTPYLAEMFATVEGIDISASHLALAHDTICKSGCKNVRLTLARPPDFGMTEPFNLWFSFIVLQHNPPPVVALVLRRMFHMLALGGIAIFQLPTYVPGYQFNVQRYLTESAPGKIEVHCLPQEVIFRLAHEENCIPLEVREDAAMDYPWLSNTFVFIKRSHD